jgi:hypothetical protein
LTLVLAIFDFQCFFFVTIEEKREERKPKTKGHYSLTNTTPHALARSRLYKLIGGSYNVTNR